MIIGMLLGDDKCNW